MPTVALKPLCLAAALTGLVAVAWAHRTPPARHGATVSRVHPAGPEAEASSRRAAVKHQLTRRVLAERMPLPAAAELFRRANGDDGIANLALGLPGRSLRERLSLQVVKYALAVEAEMRAEGHEPNGWAAELEAEFLRRQAAGEFPPEPGAE